MVAVVRRWFARTLLGTGGLVQACGDATRAAVVLAGTKHRVRRRVLQIALDFAVDGRLEDPLRRRAEVDADYSGGQPTLLTAVDPLDLTQSRR